MELYPESSLRYLRVLRGCFWRDARAKSTPWTMNQETLQALPMIRPVGQGSEFERNRPCI